MQTVEIVPKELVAGLEFSPGDVLTDSAAIRERAAMLHQAMLLGNGYKTKVRIVFETNHGTKAVETTVWQATEKQVMLKGGMNIPVRSIREVKII
jgi:hypothetical protein